MWRLLRISTGDMEETLVSILSGEDYVREGFTPSVVCYVEVTYEIFKYHLLM